ncbi:hypothetical protein VSA01S_38590 [Vibrio sagamiensis NBRC 104589]|uniref:Uncharacterized protein n=1 Tax=Vibrio sagamiensis NBRC 104589 TaxID=1219064 RepID=A0A511QKN6_9VIBR|nr:hypothetical protein VSA01S_38590 [Vibrio sagamiensis NBRC 104589]
MIYLQNTIMSISILFGSLQPNKRERIKKNGLVAKIEDVSEVPIWVPIFMRKFQKY